MVFSVLIFILHIYPHTNIQTLHKFMSFSQESTNIHTLMTSFLQVTLCPSASADAPLMFALMSRLFSQIKDLRHPNPPVMSVVYSRTSRTHKLQCFIDHSGYICIRANVTSFAHYGQCDLIKRAICLHASPKVCATFIDTLYSM